MNHKKTKSKTKKTNIKKNRLPQIFLSIFIITLIASALSYFIMKKQTITSVKSDNILKTIKEKEEVIKVPTEEIKTEEAKTFEEKTPKEYFDDLNKTPDKHEKFEEYTKEFEKDIIEKDETTDLINKENEQVLKKIEEIKEDKKKLETIINDTNKKKRKKKLKKIKKLLL